VEGRGVQRRELGEGKMAGTLRSGTSSTRLAQIAELAKRHPERVFSSLLCRWPRKTGETGRDLGAA